MESKKNKSRKIVLPKGKSTLMAMREDVTKPYLSQCLNAKYPDGVRSNAIREKALSNYGGKYQNLITAK